MTNTSTVYIEAGSPWLFRPGPKVTIEQLTRACNEFDLMVEHFFGDNEVRVYQRDLNTTPPTGAQLAESMFGPGNTVTLVEEIERFEIGAEPVDMTGIEVLEIGKESEVERARRLEYGPKRADTSRAIRHISDEFMTWPGKDQGTPRPMVRWIK